MDLELLDAEGRTALVLARNVSNVEAIEALEAAGANKHFRIIWAAQNGHASVSSHARDHAPYCLPACLNEWMNKGIHLCSTLCSLSGI